MVIAVRTERGPSGLEVVKQSDTPADEARLHHEAEMLRRAARPGVVEVVGESAGVLRLRHRGTALARLGPLAPDQSAAIVRAVADVVDSMHHQGIAHTRIGLDHVLIGERGRPRLCGFGDATAATEETTADDVAALGRLLDDLLDAGREAMWTPAHRGVRSAPRRSRPPGVPGRSGRRPSRRTGATAHGPPVRHRPARRPPRPRPARRRRRRPRRRGLRPHPHRLRSHVRPRLDRRRPVVPHRRRRRGGRRPRTRHRSLREPGRSRCTPRRPQRRRPRRTGQRRARRR